MKSKITKKFGYQLAIAAAMALGTIVASGATPVAEAIPIANFTSFTNHELSDYLTENLSPELKSEINQKKLAVFALTAKFNGMKACYAMVGLTEVASKGRNPRFPEIYFPSLATKDEKNWGEGNCVPERLRESINSLNSEKLENTLAGIEKTAALGGTRTAKKPSKTTNFMYSMNIKSEHEKPLFDLMAQHKFAEAFDFRAVESFVFSDAAKFNSGNFMCIAFAGITGNNPDSRNARWPGYTVGNVRLQTGGDIDACKLFAAKEALARLLDENWTDKGLLNNFSAGREDGIPLPNAQTARIIQLKMEKLRIKEQHTISSNNIRNHLTCTNNCVNGSCLRKFSTGRTERWQAPRVMNPFTQNWEWDITTKACGI